MVGILVHGNNHFILSGPLPAEATALALVRYWSIIQIGEAKSSSFGQWQIKSKEFLSRQRSRVRVSSSPPLLFNHLPEGLDFRVGTKRHKMGTRHGVCPGRAYVSSVFSGNNRATTAACAVRFSAVTFSSAPVDRSSVE